MEKEMVFDVKKFKFNNRPTFLVQVYESVDQEYVFFKGKDKTFTPNES